MIKGYTLDCFIIKRSNYKESDKLITVFSHQRGKQTLKAKGIRKVCSRRIGSLELCNYISMQVVQGRGDFDVITEVQLQRNYSSLGHQFQRTKIAYELLELVNTFAPEAVENDDLMELLHKAFEFLSSQDFTQELADKTSLRFKTRMLELMGYGNYIEPTHAQLNAIIEELSQRKLLAHQSFTL